jgi:hypothetical protein
MHNASVKQYFIFSCLHYTILLSIFSVLYLQTVLYRHSTPFIVKVGSSNVIIVVINPLFVSCSSGLMMAILSLSFLVVPTSTYLFTAGIEGFLISFDHTQAHTTVGRIPLDKGLARRRDLYLTTRTPYKANIHAPSGI